MKSVLAELRLLVAQWLLGLATISAPVEHPEGEALVRGVLETLRAMSTVRR